jgi:RecA-family ATPase
MVRTFDLRSLGCLLRTQFPPPRWLVSGLMSEGLNLLVGSPKQGKSILALNLALTIAGGGKALGNVQVEPADVLYLSLEDQMRRVKVRAMKMLSALPADVAGPAADRLIVCTDWPRQDEGGLRMIDLWMARAARPGLVIIDVWNRFAPQQKSGGSIYRQDADAVSAVKQFCDRRGIAAMLVHHDRKVQSGAKAEEDFVASISGTQGIAGSADGIMVLVRQRNEAQAQLKITGRDVEERELVLEFAAESLTWCSLGTSSEHATSSVQRAIIAFLRQRGSIGAFAKDVAEAIEEKHDTVRRTLNRLLTDKVVAKKGNAWIWPGDDDEVAM